jgi:hypothetical protein
VAGDACVLNRNNSPVKAIMTAPSATNLTGAELGKMADQADRAGMLDPPLPRYRSARSLTIVLSTRRVWDFSHRRAPGMRMGKVG